MKTSLRVLFLAVLAAVLHLLVLTALMSVGVGPFGRAPRLLAASMNSWNETTSQMLFDNAEQFVMLDRFVLWPTVFLLASILSVRFVPTARWWHSVVIASAVLPFLSYSAAEIPGLPSQSALSSWFSPLTQFLAYALLVAFLLYLLRKITLLRAGTTAAV